ncbi:protein of unknown function [Thauera humireducens]|nr:protein of unknown function [Thauera humireducens]
MLGPGAHRHSIRRQAAKAGRDLSSRVDKPQCIDDIANHSQIREVFHGKGFDPRADPSAGRRADARFALPRYRLSPCCAPGGLAAALP